MSRPLREETNSNQEYRLLDYVERLGRYREGRKAVHIHLSKLKSHNRRDHHLRIAANTFENLVSAFDGQLFKLTNHDLVFIFKGSHPVEVDEAVMRLRYLFNDDPLNDEVDPDVVASFCSWYDLQRQYDDLLALARSLYDEAQKRNRRLAPVAERPPEVEQSIDPHQLGALIDTIASADLSNLMRRQVVYAVLSHQAPQPLFRELFISIAELRKLILPKHNIHANRWLFQYLTETLDKRMLSLLIRNDDPAIVNSFSLNLNISTILAPEFLTFDSSLKAGARGTIVLELQMIDVYADIAAFAFARDFVHDRGYRVCLDGLNEQSFPLIDRAKLGLDLVKLDWTAGMAEDRSGERHERLRNQIEQTGKAKVILCHVDSEQGLRFGQSVGIAMYQGRYIDQLAAPKYSGIRPR